MNFNEILEAFKNSEDEVAENIILLIEDNLLKNGLLAWQTMIINYDLFVECEYEEAKMQWEWLWKNIKYDYKEFARIANVKEFEAINLIQRLKALRLIYPDASINRYARAYLRGVVVKNLPKEKKDKDKKDEIIK